MESDVIFTRFWGPGPASEPAKFTVEVEVTVPGSSWQQLASAEWERDCVSVAGMSDD